MKKYPCPLCHSPLSQSRYYEIMGVWDERARLEKNLREELGRHRAERRGLLETIRKERLQMQKEMKAAILEAAAKGKDKEKRRADKLAAMIQRQAAQLQDSHRTIEELKEQLERGTTPQVEGLNLEIALIQELKRQFCEDKIEHHGKSGDVLQHVVFKGKPIGSILYECKKTARYYGKFVDQIKRAVGQRQATYGVLVTTAFKKETAGFWVEKGILVVHPYGAVYVAEVLRRIIIEMFASKAGHAELDKRSKEIMQYICGDEFRNCVDNSIYRARELNKMLHKEMNAHKNIWIERYKHYNFIHENISRLFLVTSNIIKGMPVRQPISSRHLKELPPPPVG